MQEVTLRFWAALSVVLIVTSYVDSQEVILIADPDISPVGQVRKSLILVLIGYIQTLNSYKPENMKQEAVSCIATTGAARVVHHEQKLCNYCKIQGC
jgi:hypothetical protein